MDNCILVWRPNLESRLIKLEKKLRIPEPDKFIRNSNLQEPRTIKVHAVRVYPAESGCPIIEKEKSAEAGLHHYNLVTKDDSSKEMKSEAVSVPPCTLSFPSLRC